MDVANHHRTQSQIVYTQQRCQLACVFGLGNQNTWREASLLFLLLLLVVVLVVVDIATLLIK